MNESYQTCQNVTTEKSYAERSGEQVEKKVRSIKLIRLIEFPKKWVLSRLEVYGV
jgi:hypothetical protein